MRFKLHLNTVGIEESPISESDILVYAAKGNIYITASEHAALATITDIMGRTLHHQEISGHGQTIIPVNYKTGVYIVTVRNGKELITEKVFLK